ncbi:MAG: divergent polysaccharide deacetylase family protein [Elusimicrobiota bacterium]|nr:divergent polysaccharide deacetylase family protein [Elusimicrobiota bacterium]
MAKRKKKNKKRGCLVPLLFLSAIAAAVVLLLNTKTENRVGDCLQIEQNINNTLLRGGVPEKNITSWREEKKKNRIEWLKISKQIIAKKSLWKIFTAENILKNLDNSGEYTLASKDAEAGFTRRIEISRNGDVYCLIDLKWHRKKACLCIVIDDCGGSKKKLNRFTQLNLPLTYAILPYQKHSREIAESLARSGFDTLLHMPMEPHKADMKSLGRGALTVAMSARKIRKRLNAALSRVPGVRGMNNHMGSLFTENKEKMGIVMDVLKKEKLFFLDSATSPKSVCRKTATEHGVKCLRNNIFLDNIDSAGEVKKRLRQAASMARKKGIAIAIGHATRKHTAEAIGEITRDLKDIEIVPLSELMDKI